MAGAPRTGWVLRAVLALVVVLLGWWVADTQMPDPQPEEPSGGSGQAQVEQEEACSRAGPDRDTGAGDEEGAPRAPDVDEFGFDVVVVDELPVEAARVLELIDAGGPFRYAEKDGSTFGNYEGLLPERPRGHYREYTVDTPGLDHRGARRIVTGADGEFYWTDDHYASFERIWR